MQPKSLSFTTVFPFTLLSFQAKKLYKNWITPTLSLFSSLKYRLIKPSAEGWNKFRSSSKSLLAGVAAAAVLKPEDTNSIAGFDIPDISEPSSDSTPIVRYSLDSGQYKVLFILGGPGVGKGTQCARLSKECGWIHLSAGELLRQEQVRPGSPFKELIETCIREGHIVPHFVTISLLKAEMELYPPGTTFLIDGFPREIGQAEAFESTVIPMDLVLFFECTEEVMLGRLMQRAKTSGRTDDNIDSILKRFKTYQQSSLPVISYYEMKGKVQRIPCSGTEDDVFNLTLQILEKHHLLGEQNLKQRHLQTRI